MWRPRAWSIPQPHHEILGVGFQQSTVQGESSGTARDTWLVLAILLLATGLVWPQLFRGWIPWDDGGMALIAERVMHGDLPHRDFDEPWTGGWSYFQAALFRTFGASLAMLRVPIFVAWLAGLVGAFRITRRFLDSASSALVVLACIVWSLAAWHLPLPNWYYAPLAVAAAWAVVRFEEHPHRAWLVVAGACIGLALAVKLTGLFLLAGIAVWCVARAADAPSGADWAGRVSGGVYLAAILMTVFIAAVVLLLRALPREVFGSAAVHFLLPNACLAAWVVFRARRSARSAKAAGLALGGLLLPLALGLAVSLAPLLWTYWREGAMSDLLTGLFVRPRVRLSFVTYGPPGRVFTALGGLPVAVLFFGSAFATASPSERGRTRWLAAALGAGWGAVALWNDGAAREALMLSVRAVPILLPMFAFVLDWRSPIEGVRGRMLVLLVAVATTAQLLQVPFAFTSYFLFAALLSVLASGCAIAVAMPNHRTLLVFWGCFLLAAGGLPAGSSEAPTSARWHALPTVRGGIAVPYLDSVRWSRLDALMRTRPIGPILVVGDAPEVPFLLGRATVSRAVYDVLSEPSDSADRGLLGLARSRGVQTVVIGHRNESWAGRSLTAAPVLRLAFPEERWFGPYEVRWNARSDSSGAMTSPLPGRGIAP